MTVRSPVARRKAVTRNPVVDSGLDLAPIKQKLERAYARLGSLPPGADSTAIMEEIEQLERELLTRYTAYVEERDSTLPPKA
jgi:hypothetical protein